MRVVKFICNNVSAVSGVLAALEHFRPNYNLVNEYETNNKQILVIEDNTLDEDLEIIVEEEIV